MNCPTCHAQTTAQSRHCNQCGSLVRWRDWAVVRKLGAGGMGTAYLVAQSGQQAVLKLPHQTTTPQEHQVECRNLYLCAALGVTPAPIETTPQAVLMEYLPPTATLSLSDRIISLLRNVNILHNRGFVLVDLKPENTISTAQGTRLIDLGSLVDALRDRVSDVAATPGYAAPELYQAKVTPLADAYAAGSR